jgi:hypothetical protein
MWRLTEKELAFALMQALGDNKLRSKQQRQELSRNSTGWQQMSWHGR